MSRLDEIRKRNRARTPGEWFWANEYSINTYKDSDQDLYSTEMPIHKPVITSGWDYGSSSVIVFKTDDKEFIANAPGDITYLLELLDGYNYLLEAKLCRVKAVSLPTNDPYDIRHLEPAYLYGFNQARKEILDILMGTEPIETALKAHPLNNKIFANGGLIEEIKDLED